MAEKHNIGTPNILEPELHCYVLKYYLSGLYNAVAVAAVYSFSFHIRSLSSLEAGT